MLALLVSYSFKLIFMTTEKKNPAFDIQFRTT